VASLVIAASPNETVVRCEVKVVVADCVDVEDVVVGGGADASTSLVSYSSENEVTGRQNKSRQHTHKKKKKRQKTQVKLCLFPLAPSFFFFKGIKRKDSFVFAMASSTPQQQAVFDFALVNEQGESFAIGFDVAKPDPSFVGERFVHLGTSPTQRTVSISAIL
jgi:hypothetical protein